VEVPATLTVVFYRAVTWRAAQISLRLRNLAASQPPAKSQEPVANSRIGTNVSYNCANYFAHT
jgi:hypothetical protein